MEYEQNEQIEEEIELTPEEENLHNIINEGIKLKTRYYEMGGDKNKESSKTIKELCEEYKYTEEEIIKSTPRELLENLCKDLEDYYKTRNEDKIISTQYYDDCEGEAIKITLTELNQEILDKNNSKKR